MAIFLYRDSGSLVVPILRPYAVASSLALMLTACFNPMTSIRPDIDRFVKDYPENFGNARLGSTNVHYAWAGDRNKQPLLFVHGSPGSWKAWAHFLLDRQLQEKFYLIAIDRLGYGNSNAGISEGSLQLQAQAIIEVLKNTNQEPAILVGHSYGGPVIAKAAMIAPEKIDALVFVSSSVSDALEETKWFQYPASWWPIRYLVPQDLRVCNEEIFLLKQELQLMNADWAKIRAKVAVVHGVTDALVPIENAEFLRRQIPPTSLVFFEKTPNQGHFIPWERRDLILQAIKAISE